MKVVRLANYVAPASGGLRTALRQLGAGYLAYCAQRGLPYTEAGLAASYAEVLRALHSAPR